MWYIYKGATVSREKFDTEENGKDNTAFITITAMTAFTLCCACNAD